MKDEFETEAAREDEGDSTAAHPHKMYTVLGAVAQSLTGDGKDALQLL
jgi:hypothetical protein